MSKFTLVNLSIFVLWVSVLVGYFGSHRSPVIASSLNSGQVAIFEDESDVGGLQKAVKVYYFQPTINPLYSESYNFVGVR